MVVGVHFGAADAEQSEQLEVFPLVELFRLALVVEARCQILHDFLSHEVAGEKVVLLQQFLQEEQLAGLVSRDHVIEDELEPLGDVHLEEVVFADELAVDFVQRVVEFHELFPLVVLVRKNVFPQVHLHKVQQLEEELTDAQVLADHLSFGEGEN